MGTLDNAATRTQLDIIREHLLTYGEIDKKTALRICECDRLGARIWDLRHDAGDPMSIVTKRVTTKNSLGNPVSYAVYVLQGGA